MTSPESTSTVDSLRTAVMEIEPFSPNGEPPPPASTVDSLRTAVMEIEPFSPNGEPPPPDGDAAAEGNGSRAWAPHDEATGGEGTAAAPMWDAFSSRFREVQALLDQNRVLIAQVNENHRSKLPDNLAKNVTLIREINLNISKIVSLYSDLSSNFSTHFDRHNQRRPAQNQKKS